MNEEIVERISETFFLGSSVRISERFYGFCNVAGDQLSGANSGGLLFSITWANSWENL